MYTALAGIDTSVNATHSGFRHILFRPVPSGIETMRSASAQLATRFGAAAIEWHAGPGSEGLK